MEVFTIELPIMYGDHHVVEVRRILLEMPGVEDVYASSGFRAAEVTFDPDRISTEAIEAKLDEAGYLGELIVPKETGIAVNQGNGREGTFFRHTEAHAQTNRVVSFAQQVSNEGRGLWPCPGMEPLIGMDED
jgi:copper chaperone CopZ